MCRLATTERDFYLLVAVFWDLFVCKNVSPALNSLGKQNRDWSSVKSSYYNMLLR